MLDEVLGWSDSPPHNKVLLIKDTVAAPASFLLLYLLRRILSDPNSLVIFVGLKETLSHYSKIARKQGCNLAAHQDHGSFVYIDLLSKAVLELSNSFNCDAISMGENKLFPLFQIFLGIMKQSPGRKVWLLVDDISLLEVVAEGNVTHVRDFLHYCRTLASNKQFCSMILLTHRDVYEASEETQFAYQLEYMSETVINVEPLTTGQATDVHGQVIVEHKVPCDRDPSMQLSLGKDSKVYGFHYKLMENTVLFFEPGRHL